MHDNPVVVIRSAFAHVRSSPGWNFVHSSKRELRSVHIAAAFLSSHRRRWSPNADSVRQARP